MIVGAFVPLCQWLVKSTPGANFFNIQRASFAPVDPKSVKRYWQLDWILTLLGATRVKAVRKYVGEIEPWCQYHQHFTLNLRQKLQSWNVSRESWQRTFIQKTLE